MQIKESPLSGLEIQLETTQRLILLGSTVTLARWYHLELIDLRQLRVQPVGTPKRR